MCSPDNYDAWVSHEAEQERQLQRLPECSECGEPIQEEECYMFNDELICIHCLEDNHRKNTDDYMEY